MLFGLIKKRKERVQRGFVPILDRKWVLYWGKEKIYGRFGSTLWDWKWFELQEAVKFKSHVTTWAVNWCYAFHMRLTCRVRVTHLLVRVEFWLGCNHRGKFLGCLLLGDGDARTAQRRGRLHPGRYLPRLGVTVPWVPHGSVGKESDWIIVYRVLTISFLASFVNYIDVIFFKKSIPQKKKSSYDRSDFISAEFYQT